MSGPVSPQPTLPPELMQQTKQSLLLDGLQRVAEHSPVWMLPRLITTLNMHQHLSAARQRLCDSHRAMMKDSGVDVGQSCGDGGGISVQGDQTTTINHNGLKTWGAVALVLASLLAGSGATSLYAIWNKPTIAAVQPSTADVQNWRLGLKVTSAP